MPITALPQTTVGALGSSQSISGPISVVKELLDNAIDARATSISLEVSADCLEVIQVRDNGHGIPAVDRPLLAKPHCTSKLTDDQDLNSVASRSLGFRGQALSLIAETSKAVSVTTRVEGEDTGMAMSFSRDGTLIRENRKSHAVGTTVRIEGLFHHNPVRKMHISRSSGKTPAQIRLLLQAYAFARPSIRLGFSITKSRDARDRWTFAPTLDSNIMDVGIKIMGKPIMDHCKLYKVEHRGVHIQALLPSGTDNSSKAPASHDFISIDGRPLTCSRGHGKKLLKLTKTGLGPDTKKPFVCLVITTDNVPYDVNIEPAKNDVLFDDRSIVEEAVQQLLSQIDGHCQRSAGAISESRVRPVSPDTIDHMPAPMQDILQCHASPSVKRANQEPDDVDDSARSYDDYSDHAHAAKVDITISNPWTVAKINSFRRSKPALSLAPQQPDPLFGFYDTVAGHPPQRPNTGLWTPESSPVRFQTPDLDVSPEAPREMDVALPPSLRAQAYQQVPPDLPLVFPTLSAASTPAISTMNHAPLPSYLVPAAELVTSEAPLITLQRPSQPQQRPMKPARAGMGSSRMRPFKRPSFVTQEDPDKDAWFDIPQMHKDRLSQQRRLQPSEIHSLSSEPLIRVDTVADQGGTRNTKDIRSFMRAAPDMDTMRQSQSEETLTANVIEKPPAVDEGMFEHVFTQAQSHYETLPSPSAGDVDDTEPARPSLAAVASNEAPDPRTILLRPRTKFSLAKRTKSCLLPLERSPPATQTQNLEYHVHFEPGEMLQGEPISGYEENGLNDRALTVSSQEEKVMELVIRNLGNLLLKRNPGAQELVPDFDDLVRAALLEHCAYVDDDDDDVCHDNEEMLID